MRLCRRYLSRLLGLWLVCQTIALATPVALLAAGMSPVEELCTCALGEHETCPMHHSRQQHGDGPSMCGLGGSGSDVALLSMAGGAGVLPAAIELPQPVRGALVPPADRAPLDIVTTLDTPPPRS
jgi:hypothetical protein